MISSAHAGARTSHRFRADEARTFSHRMDNSSADGFERELETSRRIDDLPDDVGRSLGRIPLERHPRRPRGNKETGATANDHRVGAGRFRLF
jgi:hypothetical protein